MGRREKVAAAGAAGASPCSTDEGCSPDLSPQSPQGLLPLERIRKLPVRRNGGLDC